MSAPRSGRGDHETYDELAVGWALHALEPEDEAVFLRHLPDCARCARTVAETTDVMAAMAQDLPPAEPSEELRERLRAALEETEQVRRPVLPPERPAQRPEARPAVPPTPPAARGATAARPENLPPTGPWSTWDLRRSWRRRLPAVLVAAAAALVVGLGAWIVSLQQARQEAQARATEESQIVQSLLAPGQATIAPLSNHDGHSVATVVARHGQAQVVTWGLAENNPVATTYVLWGEQQGKPVALGTFDVVSTTMDLRNVGSDRTGLDGYSAYGISLEPGRTAPATPSGIIATGQVSS